MKTHQPARGFTLVEIMVAVAILTILVLMLSELLTGAQQAIGISTRHLTADAQARVVFDRMGNDFAQMIKDPNYDTIFSKGDVGGATGANDAMFFFSRAPGRMDDGNANPHSLVSLVGYRINANYQLERLGKALDVDLAANGGDVPGGPVCLTYAAGPNTSGTQTPLTASTITGVWNQTDLLGGAPSYTGSSNLTQNDPDFHLLADGVFRLSFCFLRTTTTGNATPVAEYYFPPQGGFAAGRFPLDYTTTAAAGTTHIHVNGIVVALAILDATSQELLGDVGSAQRNAYFDHALKTTFLDPDPTLLPTSTNPALPSTGESELIAGLWRKNITAGDLVNNANWNPNVAGQVRVYQRTFYLNDLQPQP